MSRTVNGLRNRRCWEKRSEERNETKKAKLDESEGEVRVLRGMGGKEFGDKRGVGRQAPVD